MRFEIRPVLQPLDLGEYEEIYRGTCLQVWVNPPSDFLKERDQLLFEYARRFRHQIGRQAQARDEIAKARFAIARKARIENSEKQLETAVDEFNRWITETWHPALNEWFSKLLSKGQPESHVTAEKLKDVDDKDSTLLDWIKNRCLVMIEDYADGKKKDLRPKSSA